MINTPSNYTKPLRDWRSSLQFRLTVLIVLVIASVLIAVSAFINSSVNNSLVQNSVNDLQETNKFLSNTVDLWLDANIRALNEMAQQPDILSMDTDVQKPVLEAMAQAYPHMYLVSTTNSQGMNIARNDDGKLTDYSDRLWYQQAISGAPLTFQTLIGRTTGQPALVVSTPIKDKLDRVIGVAMFATDLDAITTQVHAAQVGQNGISYLVDAKNQVVAHPNKEFTASLLDFSSNPPITSIRAGKRDDSSGSSTFTSEFTDSEGIKWRYAANELGNGWIAVVQIPESELLAPARVYQRFAWLALGIIIIAIALLTWFIVGRTIKPIDQLTDSSAALASGDFSRRVKITTRDELGVLAQAFNGMADQVEDLINRLEARVRERTALLEKRAHQMQVTAEVGRSITTLEKLDHLLSNAARLISEQFGYYHVGIFFLDEKREYAVLRASNSEGGQRMLAKSHRLKIGEVGIVGYAAKTGTSRIALDVGTDAVFFDNPELPLTRSELALPIIIGGELLGVLDVQSSEPLAFVPEDFDALQVLADQLAVAIQNARLYEQNQLALEASTRIYDQSSRASWIQLLSGWSRSGYLATSQGTLQRVTGSWDKEFSESIEGGSPVMTDGGLTVTTPLKVRGQVIGAIRLKKPESSTSWEKEDTNLALAFAEQLSAAIDSARLYADAQMRAARESLISDISMRATSTPQISAIVGETAKELGQAIGNTSVIFQLLNPEGERISDSYASDDVGIREIRRYVNDGTQTGYMYQSRGKLIEAPALQGAGWRNVIETGSTVSLSEKTRDDFPFIAVPVKLRDQTIGLIQVRAEQPVREWKESEISLVESIADRSAIAIENASLLAESQRRALKEKTIGEISAKISSLVDVDNIVQTALQELSRTLPDADMEIQFHQQP